MFIELVAHDSCKELINVKDINGVRKHEEEGVIIIIDFEDFYYKDSYEEVKRLIREASEIE